MELDDVVFDFDGTVVDASQRMYALFDELTRGRTGLTKSRYWALKRSGATHKSLLEAYCPEIDPAEFENSWMPLIETEEYLRMDEPYAGIVDALASLRAGRRLFLLTSRQSEPALLGELDRLGLACLFDGVVVASCKSPKPDALRRLVAASGMDPLRTLGVGDTEADVAAARAAGIAAASATWGFRSRALLAASRPDLLLDCVGELRGASARLGEPPDQFEGRASLADCRLPAELSARGDVGSATRGGGS